MKKLAFLAVVALTLGTAAAFAEPATPSVVTGTIKAITPAAANGSGVKLTVLGSDGKEFLSSPQVAMDLTGQAIGLDTLKVGQKVRVIPLAGGGSAVQLEK